MSVLRRTTVVCACAIAALTPLTFTACGAKSAASSGSSVPSDLGDVVDLTGKTDVTIDVVDNAYNPKAFKVSPGSKITFRNTGANAHNVTPVDQGAFVAITTDNFGPGKTGTISVGNPGTVRFYCTIHGAPDRGQRGAIVVQ